MGQNESKDKSQPAPLQRKSPKNSSKRVKRIKEVESNVDQIRQSIRNGELNKQDYEQLQKTLISYSQEVQNLAKKSGKKETDQLQKFVSSVSEELFKKQELEAKPPSPPPQIQQTAKPQQPKPKITNKNVTGTLDDIENKLETIKNDVKVAQMNQDKKHLHFLAKSIETLMTELQLADSKRQLINEEKKLILEKNLTHLFQQIGKIRKQLIAEEDKRKRDQYLQDLKNIENDIGTFRGSVNNQNLKIVEERFSDYRRKLDRIEDTDQDINLKKAEISDLILTVENEVTVQEMEGKLKEAEDNYYQLTNNYPESEEKQKEELRLLQEFVGEILNVNDDIKKKKNEILYNIDLILNGNQVVLRKNVTDSSNQSLIDNLLSSWEEFEKSFSVKCTPNQLKATTRKLQYLKESIERKLTSLNQDDSNPQLIIVKEQFIPPATTAVPPIIKQMQIIEAEVKNLQEHVANYRFTKDNQTYLDIKQTLEDYKIKLEELSGDNEDYRRFSKNIENYIDEVLLLLDDNLISRKSTTAEILQDLMAMNTRIHDLGVRIQNPGNTIQDYGIIRNNLLEYQQYLKNLQIAPSRLNICKSRNDLLFQIQNYLSIVDKSRTDTVELLQEDPDAKKLTEIQENVENVKKKLNATKLTKEELEKLDARLTLSKLALNNMQNDQLMEERQKLYLDIDSYFERVKELKVIIETHEKQNRLSRNVLAAQTIAEVEEQFEKIKPEILHFVGLENSEKYAELDQMLIENILALDTLKISKTNEFYDMKMKLLNEIEQYNDILEERVNQTEKIKTLENEIQEISTKIDLFEGYFGDNYYNILDEELIKLKIKVGKMTTNQELSKRKETCIKQIDDCLKKMKEIAKAGAIAGTLV